MKLNQSYSSKLIDNPSSLSNFKFNLHPRSESELARDIGCALSTYKDSSFIKYSKKQDVINLFHLVFSNLSQSEQSELLSLTPRTLQRAKANHYKSISPKYLFSALVALEKKAMGRYCLSDMINRFEKNIHYGKELRKKSDDYIENLSPSEKNEMVFSESLKKETRDVVTNLFKDTFFYRLGLELHTQKGISLDDITRKFGVPGHNFVKELQERNVVTKDVNNKCKITYEERYKLGHVVNIMKNIASDSRNFNSSKRDMVGILNQKVDSLKIKNKINNILLNANKEIAEILNNPENSGNDHVVVGMYNIDLIESLSSLLSEDRN